MSERRSLRGTFAIGAAVAALWLFGATDSRAAVIYDFNGTCQVDCGSVGLTAGDAVSGSISFGSLDLNIGSFGLLDTSALALEGWTVTATISGASLTALTVNDGANVYLFPGPSTGEQWELSLSAGGLPGGNGTWTQGSPSDVFDFAGDCQADCGSVGLTAGDAVSGSISFGFFDLEIGTFGLLDTTALALEGWTITATVSGESLTSLTVNDGANVFLFPGPATGKQWELSLSDGNLPGGTGTLIRRGANAVPEPGSLVLFGIGLLGLGVFKLRRRLAGEA